MQQVRRPSRGFSRTRRQRGLTLVTAVVLAAGAIILAGCRSDPGVAAYVGDTAYSQDQVVDISDEAYAKLRDLVKSQSAQAADGAEAVVRPVTEQEVVATLVSRDVLKALAEEKRITPISIDPSRVAQRVQVPAEAEYVKLLAEGEGYRQALMQQASTASPDDADLREVYRNLVEASGGAYTDSFTQFKSNLTAQDTQLVGRGAALRKDLQAKAEDLNVKVNPRYAPAELSLVEVSDQSGGVHPLLAASFDLRETGVRDL